MKRIVFIILAALALSSCGRMKPAETKAIWDSMKRPVTAISGTSTMDTYSVWWFTDADGKLFRIAGYGLYFKPGQVIK